MRVRRYRRRRKRRWVAAVLVLLALAVAATGTARLYAVFLEYAIDLCEDSALQEINTLMQQLVYEHPEDFAELVVLERDAQNHVTALRTDAIAIGRIKAEIVNGLFTRLDYLEQTTVEVPLGSVFAPRLLTGRGPIVHVGFAGLTQMEAEFVSAFSAAGINQTRHNILIEIHAGFRILTPTGGFDRVVVSSFPVTDTVIVGTVPEQYTYIDDTRDDLLGKINDYVSAKP